jgi:PAS domain S-box-containing protein
MNGLLRVLIVEDSEDDTLLVVREFKQAGYEISFERVQTEAAMEAALSKEKWDVIISDYVLPDFSGLRALRLLQRKGIDLPFIIVSGKIGEGVAVEAVKAGAHDYLMKNNLRRLVVAVEQEIREAENRRERKKAEEALRESQERYRALVDNTILGVTVIDTNYKIIMANTMLAKLFNKPASDFVGKNCFREYEKREAVCPHCPGVRAMASGNTTEVETQGVRDDGSRFYVRNRAIPFVGPDGVVKGFIEMVEDIDARKKAEAELYSVNRALKTLSGCNQRLIRATEKSTFLSEICQIIVGVGGYRLAWIGIAEQDEEKSVRSVAQAGFEAGYLETLNITWADTERGQEPAGTAIRTGKTCICRNIFTDPKFAPWRDEAFKRGYASSIALPIQFEDKVIGALNIYATVTDAFNESEVELLTELSNDLAYGIVTLRVRDEHKKAEEELKESQERFRTIFENVTDGILLADTETKKFHFGNKTIYQMLGYNEKEISSLGIMDIHPQKDLPYVLEQFEKQCRREITLAKDIPVKRKDGSIFYAEINSAPITLAGRTYVMGIFRDITERKKAEDELRKVNRALKVISECNQSLVRATDELSLLNEICRNLAGVGEYRLAWVGLAEQDEGKTVRPAAQAGYEEGYLENLNITWSDTERGQGPTGMAIRTGKIYICRDILTDPKFEPWRTEAIKRGYASSVAIPLISENRTLGALNIYASEPDAFDKEEVNLLWELTNDLAYGIVTLHTRAEHKQAEESLKKLSSAVEQTADIVIITDKDGAIEYVNSAFEKVTGYVKEEAVGKTPRILKSGKHDQRFYELLWQIILSGEVFRDTLINRKKNGEFYYAEKTITPIRDKEGNITHFVSNDKDITEHKELEKTQRLAQLGELVADMAHEVNNPLMIISGNAQLSLMEEIQNEKVKDNLKIIFEECRKAKDIIQRLLKFSRPSKGELKETDINKNIESVVSIVEHQFKLANIEIKRNYTENLPFILVDEKQMQEVFMNLLNNAKDAMSEGGVIDISSGLEKDCLKIDFKDTGCGMSEEVKKRVFEPFFTTKEKGTGLGLSVCYGIIKSYNGELKLESELGKGTTATIRLPLRGGDI